MSTQFYTSMTKAGCEKIAQAMGYTEKMTLSYLAMGDSNGESCQPDDTQTALENERYRTGILSVLTDDDQPNHIVVEAVIPEDIGGFYIREMGLYDDNNQRIAVGSVPETYKPAFTSGSVREMRIRSAYHVIFRDGYFLGLSGNSLYRSTDGISWTMMTTMTGMVATVPPVNLHYDTINNVMVACYYDSVGNGYCHVSEDMGATFSTAFSTSIHTVDSKGAAIPKGFDCLRWTVCDGVCIGCLGTTGYFIVSMDGGKNWRLQYYAGQAGFHICSVATQTLTDSRIRILAGHNSGIITSAAMTK